MGKGMLRLFMGLVVSSLMIGCSPRTVPSITVETRDSIIVKEVPRLVPVHIPGDTVTVKEFIECDSVTNKPKPSKIQAGHKRAKVAVEIDSTGKLTAVGGCDSLTQLLEAKDSLIKHYVARDKTIVVPCKTYEPPWYDKAARWVAGISILIFLALFVFLAVVFFKP